MGQQAGLSGWAASTSTWPACATSTCRWKCNYIRPYTYQHASYYTAYTHYQQPLAHPMGANLTEVLGVLSYQPLPRLMLVGKAFYTEQGLDYGYDAAGNIITSGPLVSAT